MRKNNENYYSGSRRDVTAFVRACGVRDLGRVLELGGGVGAFASSCLDNFNVSNYTLVDLVAGTGQRDIRIEYECTDAFAFLGQQKSESFDTIFMNDFLEHIAEDRCLLKQIARILAPEGQVFISVPNIANTRVILNLIVGRFEYSEYGVMDSTHLRFYTPFSLARLLTELGFIILVLEGQTKYSGRQGFKYLISRLLTFARIYLMEHQFLVFIKKDT
jgi:2-polyprenyl-3-methyl-5-hydroxy-6-metoxy-1,4-benzoquinol methylase